MRILFLLMVLWMSSLASAQWVQCNVPDSTDIYRLAYIDGHLFAGTYGGFLYASTDRGNTWVMRNDRFSGVLANELFVDSSSVPQRLYAATSNGLFVTEDLGLSWDSLALGIAEPNLQTIFKFGDILLTSVYNSVVDSIVELRSADNGQSWTEIRIGGAGQFITSYTEKNGDFYAGASRAGNRIYKSTDGGLSWFSVSDNNTWLSCYSMRSYANRVVAANDRSLMISEDDGQTWDNGYWGLPASYPINKLKVMGDYLLIPSMAGPFVLHKDSSLATPIVDNLVFRFCLAMEVGGTDLFAVFTNPNNFSTEIFRRPADLATGIGDRPAVLPQGPELYANYPNPFNPSTTIVFRLQKSADVSLQIYNSLGQKVRTLVSGKHAAGEHLMRWDGRNDAGKPVASGPYFYKLSVAGTANSEATRTRRMLLVR